MDYWEIYNLTEGIKETLPVPGIDTAPVIKRDFLYKEVECEVTFLKKTDDDGLSFYWISNLFYIPAYCSDQK